MRSGIDMHLNISRGGAPYLSETVIRARCAGNMEEH